MLGLIKMLEERSIGQSLAPLLLEYEAYETMPLVQLCLKNTERRWEVVSAWQKAVRRGDTEQALRLVSAVVSGEDWESIKLLWRRIGVTAIEDVGLANLPLVALCLAMGALYSKIAYRAVSPHKAMEFLSIKLCSGVKDRTFNNLLLLNYYGEHVNKLPPLMFSWYSDLKPKEEYPEDPLHKFIFSMSWATEGLGKVIVDAVNLGKDSSEVEVFDAQPYGLVKGIPEYAYDMHTRTGKHAIAIVAKKNVALAEVCAKFGIENKSGALGWLVFYKEGVVFDKLLKVPRMQELQELVWVLGMSYRNVNPDARDALFGLWEQVKDALFEARQYASISHI